MQNSNSIFANEIKLTKLSEKHIIHFMLTLNIDKVYQVRVNSRNFDFIVTGQARKYREGGEKSSPGLFRKGKKCPNFWEKSPNCV